MKIGKKEMDRKEKLEKLETLLKNVSDTYEDFVECTVYLAKKDSTLLDELLLYIDEHPEAKSSEIIEFSVADLKISE